jgi:hypothetical protein
MYNALMSSTLLMTNVINTLVHIFNPAPRLVPINQQVNPSEINYLAGLGCTVLPGAVVIFHLKA